MGFFGDLKDKIKRVFDRGGVDIHVEAPDTFRWSEGSLPVTVHLSSEATEQRVITALEFELVDDLVVTRRANEDASDYSRRRRQAKKPELEFTRSEPITLAPGEQRTIEIEVPLSLRNVIDDVIGDDAPGWMSAVGDALNVVKDVTRDDPWFYLKVRPRVEGFNAAKVATHKIRNLRSGEWGGRNWSVSMQ